MREIKFRFWSKNEHMMYMNHDTYVQDNYFNLINNNLWAYECMQYTGLKDKDGNEIYEGDILQTIYGLNKSIGVGVVEMQDGCWSVNFKKGKRPIQLYSDDHGNIIRDQDYLKMFSAFTGNSCEIIGNIHESPELLK